MHALHPLYLPTPNALTHVDSVAGYGVVFYLGLTVKRSFFSGEIYSGVEEIGFDVSHPNNLSRLLDVKAKLLAAIEAAEEAEYHDGYPEWLRFRLEQALDILQGDIEGRRLPNGLPAWNPATGTAEIREVA